jgi:hypothetical protein
MSFRIILVENVVYTSWRGFTAEELRDVASRITDLRRTLGRPVVYLARIPAGGGTFTAEDNVVLQHYLVGILPYCATIHHVIEGDGFVKSARMATVNNFARATTRTRDFIVHETLEGAFASIRSMYGVELRDKTTSPPPPRGEQRASSAFRAAARIIEGWKKKD